jgi:hypothetical protein
MTKMCSHQNPTVASRRVASFCRYRCCCWKKICLPIKAKRLEKSALNIEQEKKVEIQQLLRKRFVCCQSKPIRGQKGCKNPFFIELKIREKSSHSDTLQIKVNSVFCPNRAKFSSKHWAGKISISLLCIFKKKYLFDKRPKSLLQLARRSAAAAAAEEKSLVCYSSSNQGQHYSICNEKVTFNNHNTTTIPPTTEKLKKLRTFENCKSDEISKWLNCKSDKIAKVQNNSKWRNFKVTKLQKWQNCKSAKQFKVKKLNVRKLKEKLRKLTRLRTLKKLILKPWISLNSEEVLLSHLCHSGWSEPW